MKRLTKRKPNGKVAYALLNSGECVDVVDLCNIWGGRLAAYEDTGLEPEEIKELCTDDVADIAKIFRKMIESGEIDHLLELVQAEKDGRLVVLPCKVGDTVWVVFDDSTRKAIYQTRVQGISITTRSTAILNFGGYPVQYAWVSEVGKTVFLTREEAEAALKGGAE